MMKYAIGIDLGTSSSSIAYCLLGKNLNTSVHLKNIIQVSKPGTVESLATLPSFIQIPTGTEGELFDLLPPWHENEKLITGTLARELGTRFPQNSISSSKSWLSYSGINRMEKLLPYLSNDESIKISPYQCTRILLNHIKNSWNHSMKEKFEEQMIIIGIPASFDQSARILTSKAAEEIGLQNFTLLEEPQAAFYSWLYSNRKDLRKKLKDSKSLLVCDSGGGTTDFSLININSSERNIKLERTAVGEHLLLGGDNMDLALGVYLEKRIGTKLHSSQLREMIYRISKEKEEILSEKKSSSSIEVHGRGKRLIGNSVKIDLDFEIISKIVLDGFFSEVDWDTDLEENSGRGLKELGLPYESDPRITVHLKKFLKDNEADPDLLLLHGGVYNSETLRKRIFNQLERLYPDNNMRLLDNPDNNRGVAVGAAYFGHVKNDNTGIKVHAGSMRAFYLGLDSENKKEMKAICLVSKGLSEGTAFKLEHDFSALTNQPVQFPVYTSLHESHVTGNEIDVNPRNFQKLPPLFSILNFGKKSTSKNIIVNVKGEYTDTGILKLKLYSKNTDHVFDLDFNLRKIEIAVEEKKEELSEEKIQELKNILIKGFNSNDDNILRGLLKKIEKNTDLKRNNLTINTIRTLLEELLHLIDTRKKSKVHEEYWLNLSGFFARPGFGSPKDEWYTSRLFSQLKSGIKYKNYKPAKIQSLIFYRRICGGLNSGQQNEIYKTILPDLFPSKSKLKKFLNLNDQERAELYRLAVNLELLSVNLKNQLGEFFLENIDFLEKHSMLPWLLARLASRELIYGGKSHIIPSETMEIWLKFLFDQNYNIFTSSPLYLALMIRKTGDRKLDISQKTFDKGIKFIKKYTEDEKILNIAQGLIDPQKEHSSLILGDSLPIGLKTV